MSSITEQEYSAIRQAYINGEQLDSITIGRLIDTIGIDYGWYHPCGDCAVYQDNGYPCVDWEECDYPVFAPEQIQESECLDEISIGWSVEDVLEVAPDLTPEEASEVLRRVKHGHDATLGVTWETLEFHADMVRDERSSD